METVQVHRAILGCPDYLGEKFSRSSALIDLLLLADEEGSLCTSERSLARRWKWSVNRVGRFLRELCGKNIVRLSHGTFRGTMTEHIISFVSASYKACETFAERSTEQSKESSPSSPSLSSPTPPSITPPISPSKKFLTQDTRACESTQPKEPIPQPPFPFAAPFILSSMEREWCRTGGAEQAAREVQCKRNHLAENLRVVSAAHGMGAEEQKMFLDYWCSPRPGTSEIRAERDEYFNLEQRVASWMGRRKKDAAAPASRAEQFADVSRKFNAIMDELYGTDDNGAADGAGHNPDEQ